MLVAQVWEELKIIRDNLPGLVSNCETLTKRPPAFYKNPLPSLAGTLGQFLKVPVEFHPPVFLLIPV